MKNYLNQKGKKNMKRVKKEKELFKVPKNVQDTIQ